MFIGYLLYKVGGLGCVELPKDTNAWWPYVQVALFVVAFLTPLTYHLLSSLTERMTGLEERRTLFWGSDSTARRLQLRIKGYFIFSDYLVTEITLNTLFILLVTLGIPKGEYLWGGWSIICRLICIIIFFIFRFALHLWVTLWGVDHLHGRVRGSRLKNLLCRVPGNRVRAWSTLVLLVTVWISPLVLFILRGNNPSPWPIVVVVSGYVAVWLGLTIIWAPFSTYHLLKDHQDMVLDLGRQQRFSFENNAENYERDDIHRCREVNFIIERVVQLKEEPGKPLRILYAGCGPGTLLCELANKLKDKLKKSKREFQIVAMDFSPAMLKAARDKLRPECLLRDGEVVLVLGDFLNEVCSCEHTQCYEEKEVYSCECTPCCGEKHDSFVKDYFPSGYFNAILCLNNTLGNLIGKDINSAFKYRNRTIAIFKKLLTPEGVLILTVYGDSSGPEWTIKNKCHKKDKRYYTDKLRYLEELSSPGTNDWVMELDVSKEKPGTDKSLLYAHWFTERELRDLLEAHNFSIENDISRSGNGKVLMAVARKKKQKRKDKETGKGK